jgi:hypothetical protein
MMSQGSSKILSKKRLKQNKAAGVRFGNALGKYLVMHWGSWGTSPESVGIHGVNKRRSTAIFI